MQFDALLSWLQETDPLKLATLWQRADGVRQKSVGDVIYLRGLVEISNYCHCNCHYCGIRMGNAQVSRYRLSEADIWAAVQQIVAFDYDTVVMQAGEDRGIDPAMLARLIQKIKAQTHLSVTLSLGKQPPEVLALWKRAGADRYLLRFETANPELFAKIHDGRSNTLENRLEVIHTLKQLGYQVGSGILVGIPGQTYAMLADDLLFLKNLELHMIGCGPYLPHPETPLASEIAKYQDDEQQVPANERLGYVVIALARILCPETNIPSTTAVATLNRESGRELGLVRGANVVMPNCTPMEQRAKYEIYPAKACLTEADATFHQTIKQKIGALGRKTSR